MQQVAAELAGTLQHLRENTFYPLLSETAEWCKNNGHDRAALALFEMLRDQRAGNVERSIEELAAVGDARVYIDLVKESATAEEQWSLWEEAWRKHRGLPLLRRAIQDYLAGSIAEVRERIDALLKAHDVAGAGTYYATWHAQVMRLADAWRLSASVAEGVTSVGRRLLEALFHLARQAPDDLASCRCAVQVAATLPLSVQRSLGADDYVRVISVVYEDLRNTHGNTIAPGLVLDYWLWRIERSGQAVENYRNLYKMRQAVLNRYERFGFYTQAERQIESMRDLIVEHRAELAISLKDENVLSNRRYELKRKRAGKSTEDWEREIGYLQADDALARCVDDAELREHFLRAQA